MSAPAECWYRDRAVRSLILRGFLPRFAALNLAWEIAQLPLYTIWREASAGYTAFAVLHCTIGDPLIGVLALAWQYSALMQNSFKRMRAPGFKSSLTHACYRAPAGIMM